MRNYHHLVCLPNRVFTNPLLFFSFITRIHQAQADFFSNSSGDSWESDIVFTAESSTRSQSVPTKRSNEFPHQQQSKRRKISCNEISKNVMQTHQASEWYKFIILHTLEFNV